MQVLARGLAVVGVLGLASCAAGQAAGPDLSEYAAAGLTLKQARVDLNADGRAEIIVHVTGRDVCGSGGCLTLVYTPEADDYRQIMRATVSRLPIGLAENRTNGWSDIVVGIRGGGHNSGRAIMTFDGTAYPSNPTVPPAQPAVPDLAETILISAD